MANTGARVDELLRHESYVRALARRLVFDAELARDVEQETWLAALQNMPREGSSPRAWLAQIVRSFAFKAFRAGARRSEHEGKLEPRDVAATDPAVLLEREDARRNLIEAVAALEEPWRSTLILHFFDELSPNEIALRLGVPVKTVYERIQRGLVLLRARMQRGHGRARDAWSLAMVRLFKFAPPSDTVIAKAAMKSLLQGVLVMSVVQKVALSGAALVALVAGLWIWNESRGVERAVDSVARTAATELPELPASIANDPLEDQRVEIDSAPRTPANTRPATAEAARFGSLLLRVVWAEDKTPAAGVWMKLHQESADDVYRDTLDVHTDGDGLARVERVFAGSVKVNFDRGTQAFAQVVGGERAEATLEIPRGVDVEGEVFDIDGQPFGGADIYLQSWGASYEGFVIAKSDADGSFRIRAIAPQSAVWVSARANARAPTTQALISDAGERVHVRLQFVSAGGELSGRVVDSQGAAIAGARVLIDSDTARQFVGVAGGSVECGPAAQRVSTDSDGTFRADSLAAGRRVVRVRAAGYAPWHGEVDLFEGEASVLRVELVRGCTLAGVVRDSSGTPLGGVEVWANSTSAFTSVFRATKADGSFEMGDLPATEFEVSAEDEQHGRAETTLVGIAGEQLRWDPVLSTGLTLRVRIVAPGRELANWDVRALRTSASLDGYADIERSNDEGRVEFINCPNAPLRVTLVAPDSNGFLVASIDDVQPGGGELVIEPDQARWPSVFLSGRIVDIDGKPLGGVSLAPHNPMFSSFRVEVSDLSTGRFELGPYPPGEWSIHLQPRGFAYTTSSREQLAAGAHWDFGDIRVQRGVVVVVRLNGTCGARDAKTVVRLLDDNGWAQPVTIAGNEAQSALVAPGHYVLTVEREGCAKFEREIVVREGEEPRVEVELRAP